MRQPVSHPSSSARISISDADLLAYAEGRLEAEHNARVEGFLACNPDLAARVMQMRHRKARTAGITSPQPVRKAARSRLARLIACCTACAIGGWALAEGLDDDGPFRDLSRIPEYVDDAMRSLQITHLRIAMSSQEQTPVLDPADIERATSIRVPTLPMDWRLLDAQVYPSEEGPSISILVETPAGQRLNLFAVRAETRVGQNPVLDAKQGKYSAYWEWAGAAYVLTGESAPRELLAQAVQLAHRTSM